MKDFREYYEDERPFESLKFIEAIDIMALDHDEMGYPAINMRDLRRWAAELSASEARVRELEERNKALTMALEFYQFKDDGGQLAKTILAPRGESGKG